MHSAIVMVKFLHKKDGYLVFHYCGHYQGRKVREIYVLEENNRVKPQVKRGYILHLDKMRVVRGRILASLIRIKKI